MLTILHLIEFGIFCVLLYGLGSILLGILSAVIEVRNTPKEPMYLCPIHGPISKEVTIKFTDYEELYEEDGVIKSRVGDYDYCPLCFHEKKRRAERMR